jgi:hypothetical protein
MNVSARAPERGRNECLRLSKHDLSARRAGLLQLMQAINFGHIEGLTVREGNPILDPPPRVIRDVKFGGENGPRPETGADDFLLKSQVVELFQQFDGLKDGVIAVLEVKHGLPFRMLIEVAAA